MILKGFGSIDPLSIAHRTLVRRDKMQSPLILLIFQLLIAIGCAFAFAPGGPQRSNLPPLSGMKRPFLDQVASTLFRLEMDRVDSSSVADSKGRVGEPMEWSEEDSFANKFSELVASNDVGYKFKQWVADIVAGEYDEGEVRNSVQDFIRNDQVSVTMFSFTTCPFCRSAKDFLDEKGIQYNVMELDELEGNRGNEIRATLGKLTKRTSVPSIFINGEAIGGLNDGYPGLMPLAKSGRLETLLNSS